MPNHRSKVKRTKKLRGPAPENYRLRTRWLIDYDYWKSLSPEDLKYLAGFTDEYYTADFGGQDPLLGKRYGPEHRERGRAQNGNERDLLTRNAVDQRLDTLAPEHDGAYLGEDWAPAPAYQTEPEYQAALAEYRRLVDTRDRTELQERRFGLLGDYLLSFAASEGAGPEDDDDHGED